MIRLYLAFLGFLLFANSVYSQSGEEPTFFGGNESPVPGQIFRIGYPECTKYHRNGTITSVLYDQCTSFCCGGTVIANRSGVGCCGSEELGSPYFPRYQKCCKWWTGLGKGQLITHTNECCGAEKIQWGVMSCCFGDIPQVFNHRKQLCCNGHTVTATGPIEYATCCGNKAAYDRRMESCPCEDGNVLKNPKSLSACCETVDGLKTPYNTLTQFCCNGKVGDIGKDFCCGASGLGSYGEQVCCTDKIFKVDPPNENLTACCNGKAYDPKLNLCCNDVITEILVGADKCCGELPYSEDKSICCMGNLLNRDTEGTECCATFAFFPDKGSFCCNDQVFQSENVGGDACCGSGATIDFYYKADSGLLCCEGVFRLQTQGDTCCGSEPYFAATAICCDRQISERTLGNTCCHGQPYFPVEVTSRPSIGKKRTSICCENGPFGPFKSPRCCGGEGYDIEGGTICCGDRVYGKYSWPSCCVDVGYDAKTHTCCGAVVRENPAGSTSVTCCGNNPYDQDTEMCCSGLNMTIPDGVPKSKAKCCDLTGIYHEDDQLCCLGKIYNKTNRWTSKCCGNVMYQSDEQICCDAMDGTEPVLNDFEFGVTTTKCCGIQLYNSSKEFCCEGFLEDKVHDETGCCAGVAFDKTKQICCLDTLQNIGTRVPYKRAECCGAKCMYRGPQRCCNNRIYARNKLSDRTCEDFK